MADPMTAGGVTPPRVVLGTMTFGSQIDTRLAERMVMLAFDFGVSEIDTANVYGTGDAERVLGSVLAGRRDQVVLASKVGIPTARHPDAPLSAAAMREELEGSLRRLNTDYLDVYYLHSPDRATDPSETLQAMAEFVDEGKVRRVGVSNYAAWQIADLECLARSSGWAPPVVSQVLYNLLSRQLEAEYEEFARTHRIETVVYNALAGGLLSGRYRRGNDAGEGGRFNDPRLGSRYRDRYWQDEKLDAMEQLRVVAEDAGMTLIELAHRWLLSRPVVDGVLFGASKIEQLRTNLELCNKPPISSDVAARCDAVWAQVAGAAPAYNR